MVGDSCEQLLYAMYSIEIKMRLDSHLLNMVIIYDFN